MTSAETVTNRTRQCDTNLAFDSLSEVRHGLFKVLIRTRTFAFSNVKHSVNKYLKPCLNTCSRTAIQVNIKMLRTISCPSETA